MRAAEPSRETEINIRRAAMYVRMSTDHQKYSTENQADAIREYATRGNIEIVRTYTDSGKSGLSLDGRDALQSMIRDVESGNFDYTMILVLDVTRWGRFQDADESAYYEYLCRRAGIDVQYVAEQFENDGSPVSTIVKGVKRAMAGEYSRELSSKVFAGQCRLIELGYRQGGPAGYGLRRVLLDEQRQRKAELRRGEHKSLQTDRVILVPGPEDEVENVRWIYRAFTEEGLRESEIAALLNGRGVKTDLGRDWTRGVVHTVLTNEKYIGNNIFNRRSFKLKKRRVENEPNMWVRADGVFDAIIEPRYFYTAQGIIRERNRKFSDDEMLAKLRALHGRQGWLSGILIDETDDMPSSSAYAYRFGGLVGAYRLIGYEINRDLSFIEDNRHIRRMHPEIVAGVIERIGEMGGRVTVDPDTDLLIVNDEVEASLVICRCTQSAAGQNRWRIQLDASLMPDITIAVRLAANNRDILDYYLIPAIDVEDPTIRLRDNNHIGLDAYRFDELEVFFTLAERVRLSEVF
ncbi:recombinase family protein [Asticcacaulis sp.]|uniref:recombinase family protein n=1 Tax=Asticcacaulis sp. TaxID=1872648 RepID=UPI002C92E866|nr:recombinase family protein [Asticcacaulis sp.]HTM81953.1 recombinase family protein [Asticcacaulis sp.]